MIGDRDIFGLVVDGGLTIDGALVNADMESGAFLLVLGPLKARNASGGGAEIIIQGPATVSDAVIGHYNDGRLHFNGGLETPLCISSDHDLSISEPQRIDFNWSEEDDVRNEIEEQFYEASKSEGAYDVLPIALAQRVRADLDSWERLESAMQRGKAVLFRPDGAPARGEAADPVRIGAQWDRLRLVPEAERTAALCDAALANSGWALIYTPQEHWTDERLAEAVRRSPELLHGVIPAGRVTEEMILIAARRLGFDSLPSQFRTEEVLINVLREAKDDPELKTLAQIPAKYMTLKVVEAVREIYADHPLYKRLEAVRSNVKKTETFHLLGNVWSAFLTETNIIQSLKLSGQGENIHPSAMTPAVCDAMVDYSACHLYLIPPELVRDHHVDLALRRDGLSLRYVPEVMRTAARCEQAVRDDGQALEFVPPELVTPALCELAVGNDGIALAYVPAGLRTEALCRRAVLRSRAADLALIPEAFRDKLAEEARAFEAEDREARSRDD
ncbi:MAG: hypothetical protein HY852_12135 [Bradyrhizobium sp.]|uniref:hypothetical protein n=1 Tax=Bradyrhizobium sp. TaxID=376 RepID=UPI0025C61DBF|nr:hypothetical protein [Bradyrhizobium sp.]MBI5262552.1 hypothetical protein [Bradyrhizobium sp.]